MTSLDLNRRNRPQRLFPLLLLVCYASTLVPLYAQRINWNVSFTTEGQWNMTTGGTGWCNLLEVGTAFGLWHGAELEIGALSTYDAGCPVGEDRQAFSNIETGENKAFRLIHAGLNQQIGSHWSLFAGLRSVDADYFTSPFTSLFTGSSHGIFPTLSENFPIGTFPLAALALHAEYSPNKHITLKESLYNGVASDCLNRQFGYRPQSEGTLNIGSLCYQTNTEEPYIGHYSIGYVLGTQPHEYNDLSYNYSLWGLVEQHLADIGRSRLGVLLQGGIAPASRSQCSSYWGAGAVWNGLMKNGNGDLGIIINRAIFTDGTETDTELTVSLPLCKWAVIQPAIHCIHTDGHSVFAGQLRLCFEIGN